MLEYCITYCIQDMIHTHTLHTYQTRDKHRVAVISLSGGTTQVNKMRNS